MSITDIIFTLVGIGLIILVFLFVASVFVCMVNIHAG